MGKEEYQSGEMKWSLYSSEMSNVQTNQYCQQFLDEEVDFEEFEQEVKAYVA